MLGDGIGFRISKHAGTKSDRDFDSNARVGFALEYRNVLDRGRQLACQYESWNSARFGEILRQASVASAVLFATGFKLDTSKIRETDRDAAEMIKENLLHAVPEEIKGIWRSLSMLPDFKNNTVHVWTRAAMAVAKARCGGDWVNGPWPEKLKGDADARTRENCSEKYAFREAVEIWIKYGFLQLADGRIAIQSSASDKIVAPHRIQGHCLLQQTIEEQTAINGCPPVECGLSGSVPSSSLPTPPSIHTLGK